MKDYERLEVWQWSHALVLELYSSTKDFPKEETYALTSQMRRAATSIAANIAEGCGRSSDADFKRFLDMAYGSAAEVSYYVRLASDLGYLKNANADSMREQLLSIRKMLAALIRKLRPASKPALSLATAAVQSAESR